MTFPFLPDFTPHTPPAHKTRRLPSTPLNLLYVTRCLKPRYGSSAHAYLQRTSEHPSCRCLQQPTEHSADCSSQSRHSADFNRCAAVVTYDAHRSRTSRQPRSHGSTETLSHSLPFLRASTLCTPGDRSRTHCPRLFHCLTGPDSSRLIIAVSS